MVKIYESVSGPCKIGPDPQSLVVGTVPILASSVVLCLSKYLGTVPLPTYVPTVILQWNQMWK